MSSKATYEVAATVLGHELSDTKIVASGFLTRGAAVKFAQDQNSHFGTLALGGETFFFARTES